MTRTVTTMTMTVTTRCELLLDEDEDEEESDSDDSDGEIDAAEEKRRKQASVAAAAWKPTEQKAVEIKHDPLESGTSEVKGQAFQRVKDVWHDKIIGDHRLSDNSYASAFGEDGWGAKASEKVLKTRGKDFRHEKTKLKRSYNSKAGGAITMASNSYKYPSSDDE